MSNDTFTAYFFVVVAKVAEQRYSDSACVIDVQKIKFIIDFVKSKKVFIV